jgi:hypothetical protein
MMKLRTSLFALLTLCLVMNATAQDYRWKQRVEYKMDIHLDVKTHKVKGVQKLTYYNNSKDTLRKVYYHLFFNAFQPGSMMDVRSRNLVDPDGRVMDRIAKLKDNEIGYQHVHSLKQDGKPTTYAVHGTILEVTLPKPILPNTKTVFDMEYESQVPVQIRRSGRQSSEGIAYSMTQWYPKMAAYDHQGWHPYQYVAREFHGVFGDFDVKITLDPTYIIGGTGVLQNADKVGYGYEKPGTVVKRPAGNLTWHFVAKNVIDFAWAADPDYTHTIVQVPNGPRLHFLYQKNEKTADNWAKLPDYAVKHFQFMNERYGKYPYECYAIIQGGDGGMEYPMCTLIAGEKSLGSLVGTTAHEISHSWYQGVLASNEALHGWFDEGFADFTSQEFMGMMLTNDPNPHARSYAAYFALLNGTLAEPSNQHSDHFNTNRAYSTQTYALGTVFLHQLKYIVGEENFYKGMLRYYNAWKFHHPEPNDFIRIMEKVSGMELKWYLSYMINTNKKIDYSVKNAIPRDNKTLVTLERLGDFPMPIDVVITYANGNKELVYIPMNEMLGSKPVEGGKQRRDLTAWPWVNPTYTFEVNAPFASIAKIEIDPTNRLADINSKNNVLDLSGDVQPYVDPTK